jgi:hypothetical protein
MMLGNPAAKYYVPIAITVAATVAIRPTPR